MMKHKVLVVDDDQEMLLSLKDGIEQYDETLSVLLAGDGVIALEKMKESGVSVVVSDLKMPRMDGLSLMAQMNAHYPDIPFIVITGYSTEETEREAIKLGAVAYLQKPFVIKELAGHILKTLDTQSDGGTLHNVSSGMFLQLMEMEERTCTIRMKHKATGKQGVLFFRHGELFDARINGLKAEAAAYEIFSWEEVSLSIQNMCPVHKKKIQADLQAILLEAMRLKDEGEHEKKKALEKKQEELLRQQAPAMAKSAGNFSGEIRDRITQVMGSRSGMEDVYQDASWDELLVEFARMGALFSAGELRVGYVDMNQKKDFVLLPGKSTTVVTVSPKCPRDRILEILGN